LSLWAVAAAAVLFVLLGLLGSRFGSALASPADGLLYRGVIYTMAGTVALHLVLTVLDFAGVRWSLPVLAVGLVVIAGVAGIASAPPPKSLITPALFSHRGASFDAPGSAPAQDPHHPGPLLPPPPTPHTGRRGRATRNRLACIPPLPGRERGLGGEGLGWGNAEAKLAPLGLGGEGRGKFAWGDALALFALAVFTALALSGWIVMPDYIYHWGFKGYRFYLARGVDYPFLAHVWNWSIHPEYPNLVPEMFAVTALLAGSFEVPAMMFGTAVLFALFVAACREGLRQGGAPPFVQQAGTALVALSSAAFGIGYIMAGAADWYLALAFAAAVPPLLRPPDRTGDLQIAVIAAFAAGSKLEGVPLAGFLVAVQVAPPPEERTPAEPEIGGRHGAAAGGGRAAVAGAGGPPPPRPTHRFGCLRAGPRRGDLRRRRRGAPESRLARLPPHHAAAAAPPRPTADPCLRRGSHPGAAVLLLRLLHQPGGELPLLRPLQLPAPGVPGGAGLHGGRPGGVGSRPKKANGRRRLSSTGPPAAPAPAKGS